MIADVRAGPGCTRRGTIVEWNPVDKMYTIALDIGGTVRSWPRDVCVSNIRDLDPPTMLDRDRRAFTGALERIVAEEEEEEHALDSLRRDEERERRERERERDESPERVRRRFIELEWSRARERRENLERERRETLERENLERQRRQTLERERRETLERVRRENLERVRRENIERENIERCVARPSSASSVARTLTSQWRVCVMQ